MKLKQLFAWVWLLLLRSLSSLIIVIIIAISLSLLKYKIDYEKIKIKKRRMRIFGARSFTKSFGEKIQNFQIDSNDMKNLKKTKNGACVF